MIYTLQNDILTATLAEPGAVYGGTRFDWTSQILSLRHVTGGEVLDRELPHPPSLGAGGMGLASEFGIRTPIGYDDCPLGDWFPKIGIGWLGKDSNEPYFFADTYPRIDPGTWSIQQAHEGELTVTMESGVRRGYGWKLERSYSLEGSQVHCSIRLSNLGTKPLESEEYCHNFLATRPLATGQFHLSYSWGSTREPEKVVNPGEVLTIQPQGISIAPGVDVEYYVSLIGQAEGPNAWWQLSRKDPSGRLIPHARETVSLPLQRCDLWGRSHVVSPELTVPVVLGPGQSLTWDRRLDLW